MLLVSDGIRGLLLKYLLAECSSWKCFDSVPLDCLLFSCDSRGSRRDVRSILHLLKMERYFIAFTASDLDSSIFRGGDRSMLLAGDECCAGLGGLTGPRTLFSIFSSNILSSTACWSATTIIDFSVAWLPSVCGTDTMKVINFASVWPMTLASISWFGDSASGKPSSEKCFGYWYSMLASPVKSFWSSLRTAYSHALPIALKTFWCYYNFLAMQ